MIRKLCDSARPIVVGEYWKVIEMTCERDVRGDGSGEVTRKDAGKTDV